MASGKSGNSLHDLLTVDKNGKTRGHSLKLIKKYSKGNTRHHFFTERVVSRWNALPQEAVCAPSINAFKGHLTRICNTKMGFSRIADPLSLKVNLGTTELANPVSIKSLDKIVRLTSV